jgi:hypothetical protein
MALACPGVFSIYELVVFIFSFGNENLLGFVKAVYPRAAIVV